MPVAKNWDEAKTVATSIQTWRHYGELTKAHTLSVERYEPYLHGRSQWRHPPGLTWLHVAVLANTANDDAGVDRLILIARLVSAAAFILTIAAIFWAGHSIGGTTTALFAGLVCAANPVLVYFGRLATPTMSAIALQYISIAAAVWAIRPLRPAPSVERQFVGWLLCGIAGGLAVMTRGAWALPESALVIVMILILCPNRISHLLGLLAALLIAVLMVAPWVVYVHGHDADAWREWVEAARPAHDWFLAKKIWSEASHRILLVLAAILPWTLWVFGGFIQPFSTSSAGSRTRLFLGLMWFLVLLLMLLIRPSSGNLTDVIPLLPAAALLVGQLLNQYSTLVDEGRSPRLWRFLRWPHLLMLGVCSAAVPVVLYWNPDLFKQSVPGLMVPAVPTLAYAAGMGVVLMGIVLLSLRWSLRGSSRLSHFAWAIWTVILLSLLAFPATENRYESRRFVAALSHTAPHPVYWLSDGDGSGDAAAPHPMVLLYGPQEKLTSVKAARVDELLMQADPGYLTGPIGAAPTERLRLVAEEPDIGVGLWKLQVVTPETGSSPEPESPPPSAGPKPAEEDSGDERNATHPPESANGNQE